MVCRKTHHISSNDVVYSVWQTVVIELAVYRRLASTTVAIRQLLLSCSQFINNIMIIERAMS